MVLHIDLETIVGFKTINLPIKEILLLTRPSKMERCKVYIAKQVLFIF